MDSSTQDQDQDQGQGGMGSGSGGAAEASEVESTTLDEANEVLETPERSGGGTTRPR